MRALRVRSRRLARRFRRRFRREVEDPNVPLSLDMGQDSSTLLIAFGGMAGELGVPPFEFFRSTGGIPVKRLFVRDLLQVWYHRGIPGHGADIEQVAASLRAIVAANGVERLVVAGNSAGGYAALLFGTLLGADVVLCFSPQTVIDPEVLEEMDDHRWDEQLHALIAVGGVDRRWMDLGSALPAARSADTRYELYFDESFRADRLHAERLEGLPGLNVHRLQEGEHDIVREMRDSGELERVLERALR